MNRITTALGVAWRRIRRRPVRSFLLLQGTVWGVAVAIFPSAVLQGTREAMNVQGARLGVDRFSIAADSTASSFRPLRASDLASIRGAEPSGVARSNGLHVKGAVGLSVLGSLRTPGTGEDADTTEEGRITVLASTARPLHARGFSLAAGRDLTAEDDKGVCVIEAAVVARLWGPATRPEDALGKVLALPPDQGEARVVGVSTPQTAEMRRSNDLGFDVEHRVYKRVLRNLLIAMGMPALADEWKRSDACIYRPIRAVSGDVDPHVEWIMGRADHDHDRVAGALRDRLQANGKVTLVLTPLVLPGLMNKRVDRFAAVPFAMFLACLVMGAVVMANLGLLNTLSRREEIAVQRVEGATRRDIAWQFLFEGLLLSVLGCVLGCLLGMALAELRVSLEPVTGFTWRFPWREAGIAVGVALLIGLLASWIPAVRASRQEPVTGLHDA